MGFRLQITGAEQISLDENMIRTAETELFTPEDSRARASKSLSTIVVTGKLYAAEEGNETMKLFNWAHVPAESEDAYRDVMLTVVFGGNTFRQVHLSKAFVVDYQESYEDTEGFGTFRLVVRQKTDLVDKVTAGAASPIGSFATVGGGFGGALSSTAVNPGKIMGEIAKQAAQVEAVKQAGKISPLAGQITQAAATAAAMVQQSAGKSAGILNGNNTGMNMDDFIMH